MELLNSGNYFSREANEKYMSVSQYKAFRECPARALAEIRGEHTREKTTALMIGSYVDAYYEGTLNEFKSQNPELFTTKGALKAEYRKADEIIDRLGRDELFTRYMSGEKQVIQTGVVGGVDFKIKIDALHPGKAIVDLKIVRDFDSIFDPRVGKRVNFISFWGYDIQGAVYQEVERQSRGSEAKPLPFFIAAATKETVTDFEVIYIPQEYLDTQLDIMRGYARRFQLMKTGEFEAGRCGGCDYCKATKRLDKVVNLENFMK